MDNKAIRQQKTKTKPRVSSVKRDKISNSNLEISKTIRGDVIGKGHPLNVDSKNVKEGKHVGRMSTEQKKYAEAKKQNEAYGISGLTSQMSQLGFNVEQDEFDSLDLFAQNIMELLNSDIYTLSNLSKHEKFILYRFFYRHNPIVGRILDLHTEIPASKMRLQSPKNCPEIVKDFVMNFFNRIFDRINLAQLFKDFVMQYNLYGESYAIVDDYYKEFSRTLDSISSVEDKTFNLSDDDLKEMADIEERYAKDPASVLLDERLSYLKKKFGTFFESDYKGPADFRIVKFYEIVEYMHNPDIKFEAIEYELNEGLKALLGENRRGDGDYAALKEVGYSDGFIDLIRESENNASILIDNDIYSQQPYLLTFKRFESSSMLQRVVEACMAWDASKRALKKKIALVGKVGRLFHTEDGVSSDQIDVLRGELEMMLENPDHMVVTNYEVGWEEITSSIKDDLQNLIDMTDTLKEEIALGLGMPDSLLSGDSQYSGDNIKVEIMNTQYLSFKMSFQNLINKDFLKAIALRKGLISIDDWGNPQIISPSLTFGLVNLRADEYYDSLFTLYQKGSLPVGIIYDLLNIEAEDVDRELKKDLWTIRSDKMNDLIGTVLDNVADDIYSESKVKDLIMENLNLKSPAPKNQEPEDEKETDDTDDDEGINQWKR